MCCYLLYIMVMLNCCCFYNKSASALIAIFYCEPQLEQLVSWPSWPSKIKIFVPPISRGTTTASIWHESELTRWRWLVRQDTGDKRVLWGSFTVLSPHLITILLFQHQDTLRYFPQFLYEKECKLLRSTID